MMDDSFVRELRDGSNTPVILANARTFIPAGWAESFPKVHHVPTMVVQTLSGFADYCTANRDRLPLEQLVVHVKDPGRVELRAALEDVSVEYRRHTYLVATTEMTGRCPLTFGQYVDAETFYIGLQVGFLQTEQRDDLLKLVASIRENSVREIVDSGVSQEVKTGRGVTLIGPAAVPNPVLLAPFRTFRDIEEQPRTLFVLRMREGQTGDKPQVALFEADGGLWKLQAIQRIAAYLRGALPDGLAVLA